MKVLTLRAISVQLPNRQYLPRTCPHLFLFLILLDQARNSNSGNTDIGRAQSYLRQDPNAGSPAKGLEGGSSSSGCLDDSVHRDQCPAPPGPGQGCCKT